ncbi:MAG: NAD-dependent epimerase/dehydratase family protein [Actinomycetota bacterium]
MTRALIIGGTRNLGPSIVQALLERGYDVSVFNRGKTRDALPGTVRRLHGDRSDPSQLRAAVGGQEFDLLVDTTLYTGAEAQAAVELFSGRVGRFVFLSTGQVYLLRPGLNRPFKEEDYAGPVMPEPPRENEIDYSNWLYGHGKRQAEDVFVSAWAERAFPYTSLRLPMINSERDHYHRIYGYILRLRDGGPILLPDGPGLPLRHVYGEDVVQAIVKVAESDFARGKVWNIGQDESMHLDEFLSLLAKLTRRQLKMARIPGEVLENSGLLPDCSPFSGRWMSALDNTRSKLELGMLYTPLPVYLEKLVRYFAKELDTRIEEYSRRGDELKLALEA